MWDLYAYDANDNNFELEYSYSDIDDLLSDTEYTIIELKNDRKSFSSLYGKDAAEIEDDDFDGEPSLTDDGYKTLSILKHDIESIFDESKKVVFNWDDEINSNRSIIVSELLDGSEIEIGIEHNGRFYPKRIVE